MWTFIDVSPPRTSKAALLLVATPLTNRQEGGQYRGGELGGEVEHAVFWPAFLLSAGEPPPTRIQVHPYLTVEGTKLSKSAGSAVNPVDVADTYGVDALRWWFAREVNPVTDTDFTVDRLVARANEDLAGGVGNVANRIVTPRPSLSRRPGRTGG